ncbi:MAG: hypothetical protein AAFV25_25270, partial [Bacteroidota bacterium]
FNYTLNSLLLVERCKIIRFRIVVALHQPMLRIDLINPYAKAKFCRIGQTYRQKVPHFVRWKQE